MSDVNPFGAPYGAIDPFQAGGLVDATQEPVFAAPGGALSTVLSEFQYGHGAGGGYGALTSSGGSPSTASGTGGSGVASASLAPGVGGLFSQLLGWLSSVFTWG